MKILLVCDLYWPAINGIATFTRSLAMGLADQGHEVMVAAPSQKGKGFTEVDGNYTVARVTSLPFPMFPNYRLVINGQKEVKKIISDFRPDVIHIQTPLGVGYAARNVAKKLNIPVVATNHAMPENIVENLRQLKALSPLANSVSYLVKEFGVRFHANVDYITMPTTAAIDMFGEDRKSIKAPVEAVSNGIDLSRFAPGTVPKSYFDRFNLPADKPIVMYLGRLDAEKHLHILVEAMAVIRKKIDAHLLIVGHGNDADNLRQLARNLDIAKHVTLTGRVEDEDMPKLCRTATVFAMPSPAELQSIATLEAMACGLPVVAVDAGALYELCQDGRNGYLVKTDDSAQMAEKIAHILSDKKLQAKMSQQSLEIAATHDIRHTIEQFETIYQKVIRNHKSKPKTLFARLRSR